MAATTLYPTTLSKRKIRLLIILPSGKDPQLPIACELQEYFIDFAPEYEALSYCWGDSNNQKDIVCNGLTSSVTINLYDALSRLRLEDKPRIIWADALCINQSNNEEKSFQVSSMGRIYAAAIRVVVWLGHGDKTHALQIEEVIENLREDFPGSYDIFDKVGEFERMVEVGSSLNRQRFIISCDAFATFFSSPWFTRMWVVQEIRLASEAIMYWGDIQLDWQHIKTFVMWMAVESLAGRDPPVTGRLEALMMITNIGAMSESQLLGALTAYRGFYTSDARDNIYGILGLPELDEEKHLITVDYSMPVAELYNEVGTIIMRQTADLEIFRYVHHPSDYDGEPEYMSWVPRWDSRSLEYTVLNIKEDIPPQFLLHPSSVLVDKFCKEKRELSLTGLYSDVVSRVDKIPGFGGAASSASSYPGGSPTGSNTHSILQYWYNHVSRDPPFLTNNQSAILSLAYTLTAGEVTAHMDLHWRASEEQSTAYLQSFLAYMNTLYDEKLDRIDSDHAIVAKSDDTGILFRMIADRVCDFRVLFECPNGSYGLGPSCLREGDVIVHLEGAWTPHALRPRDGCYLFLGQVYVESIMDGELVRLMEEGKIQKQEFRLI